MKPVRFAVVVLVAALAACSSPPKDHYYTLGSEGSAPAPSAAAAVQAPSVVVGPVTVPEAVDQPQLVVRVAANQVRVEEFHRWASSLKNEIALAIAANLVRDLGATRVWTYSPTALPDPDFQVLVDVQRFDSMPGEATVIDAVWTVRAGKGGTVKSGRSTVREAAGAAGYDALVAAHGRALARMSADIAAAIRGK